MKDEFFTNEQDAQDAWPRCTGTRQADRIRRVDFFGSLRELLRKIVFTPISRSERGKAYPANPVPPRGSPCNGAGDPAYPVPFFCSHPTDSHNFLPLS